MRPNNIQKISRLIYYTVSFRISVHFLCCISFEAVRHNNPICFLSILTAEHTNSAGRQKTERERCNHQRNGATDLKGACSSQQVSYMAAVRFWAGTKCLPPPCKSLVALDFIPIDCNM